MTSYFHGFENLEWKSMDDQFPENQNSFYTRVPGMIKMGLVKLEKDGHFQLHWHKGIYRDHFRLRCPDLYVPN